MSNQQPSSEQTPDSDSVRVALASAAGRAGRRTHQAPRALLDALADFAAAGFNPVAA